MAKKEKIQTLAEQWAAYPKCIQEERRSRGTVFGISFPGKAYQRAGSVFTPECRKLPVFMESNAE